MRQVRIISERKRDYTLKITDKEKISKYENRISLQKQLSELTEVNVVSYGRSRYMRQRLVIINSGLKKIEK